MLNQDRPGRIAENEKSSLNQAVGIGFHSITFVVTCVTCSIGFPSLRAPVTHLRVVHVILTVNIQSYVKEAAYAAQTFAADSDSQALANLYDFFCSMCNTRKQAFVSPITSLAGFPIRKVLQCLTCYKHHSTLSSLPSHLEKFHGYSPKNAHIETNRLCTRHMLKLQSFFGGDKTWFFPANSDLTLGEVLVIGTIPPKNAGTHEKKEFKETKEIMDSNDPVESQEPHPVASEQEAGVIPIPETTISLENEEALPAFVKSLFEVFCEEQKENDATGKGQNRSDDALK